MKTITTILNNKIKEQNLVRDRSISNNNKVTSGKIRARRASFGMMLIQGVKISLSSRLGMILTNFLTLNKPRTIKAWPETIQKVQILDKSWIWISSKQYLAQQ